MTTREWPKGYGPNGLLKALDDIRPALRKWADQNNTDEAREASLLVHRLLCAPRTHGVRYWVTGRLSENGTYRVVHIKPRSVPGVNGVSYLAQALMIKEGIKTFRPSVLRRRIANSNLKIVGRAKIIHDFQYGDRHFRLVLNLERGE